MQPSASFGRVLPVATRFPLAGALVMGLCGLAGLASLRAAEIQVDEKARRISFPGKVAKQGVYKELKGAVEYLLCCPGGKEYESLFVAPIDPSALHAAMVKLGLKSGSAARDEPGKYVLPTGARVRIVVEWNDGKEQRRARAESFAFDSIAQKSMPEVDWVFTGSVEAKDPATGNAILQAVLTKNLVSFHHKDRTVLLQNPLTEGQNDSRYTGNAEALPKEGTAVTIVFEPAPPVKVAPPPGSRRIHLMITGQVQGVGFREFALRTARQLGVRGWVRNLPTGEVELEAEGPEAAVKEFEPKVKQGPRGSKVDNVNALSTNSGEALEEFEIRETPAKP